MSSNGIVVSLFWDEPIESRQLAQLLQNFCLEHGDIQRTGRSMYAHPTFGKFHFGAHFEGIFRYLGPFIESPTQDNAVVDRMFIQFYSLEMLPDLVALGAFSMSETDVRLAYQFVKDLFVACSADICCGATTTDQEDIIGLDSWRVDRLFRFTKSGPQRGIRPFEEGRPIGSSANGICDYGWDKFDVGYDNWVVMWDGPLWLLESGDRGSWRRV